MDRIGYAVLAAILDVVLGVSSLLHLPLLDLLALISFVSALYSFLPMRELTFTVPVSLVPSLLLSGSPAPLILASVLSVLSYYLREHVTSFLLVLSLSLAVMNSGALIQTLGYLVLTASLLYLRADLRGVVGNGILFLILAAFFFTSSQSSLVNQLSDVSFYSLFFGVFGMAVEGRTLPRRLPRAPLLFVPYALLTLTLGIPEAYYWWTSKSFFFRVDPLSLWVPLRYFPQVNEVAGSWPLSHLTVRLGEIGVDLYIAILVYVSGMTSYLMFRGLRVRYPSLLALVYQLLSPFDHPYLLFGYSVLPLTLWLMNSDVRAYLKYPAVMVTSVLGSSYFLFPLQASLLGGVTSRRGVGWAVLAMIGANLFWIVPYSLLGTPSLGEISDVLPLTLLLPLVVSAIHFGAERRYALLSIASLAYISASLPYGEALYPVAVISTLLTVNRGKALIAGLTIFILLTTSVYQLVSFHPVQIPSTLIKAETQVENATLVWWNTSYPLLSSAPTNETPVSVTAIQYVVGNGTVKENPNYTGFPLSIRVILPSNFIRVNGSWISENRPVVVVGPNNFTYSYRSGDLSLEQRSTYVLVNSKLGLQFLDWKFSPGNSSAFSVSVSGEWLRLYQQVYLALAQNVTQNVSVTPVSFNSLAVTLGNPSPILQFSPPRIDLLGYGAPLNLTENFTLTLYFLNAGGYVELYGEQINGELHQLSVLSHLPWGNVTDVILLLPLGNQLELRSLSISTLLPLNLTQNWVAWSSPRPANLTFLPSVPLNGTLYFSSSPPVRLQGVLANGSSLYLEPGSVVVGLKEVTITSPPGTVNLTSLVLVNGTKEYYVVGKFNVSTKYVVNQTLVLGGLLDKIETPVDLNVTVIPLPVSSNLFVHYLVDGKVSQNRSFLLTPGEHSVMIYFPAENLVYQGLYFSVVSFPLTFIIALLSERLKTLFSKVNRVLERMASQGGSEGGAEG